MTVPSFAALERAHCVEHYNAVVVGATSPSGAPAVVLGMLPPDGTGWTFPLPIAEARHIAALLVEMADKKDGPPLTDAEFSETKALLIALEDGESERLSEYLTENFLPNELANLARACRAISWTASDVRSEVERRYRAGNSQASADE